MQLTVIREMHNAKINRRLKYIFRPSNLALFYFLSLSLVTVTKIMMWQTKWWHHHATPAHGVMLLLIKNDKNQNKYNLG